MHAKHSSLIEKALEELARMKTTNLEVDDDGDHGNEAESGERGAGTTGDGALLNSCAASREGRMAGPRRNFR